MCARHEGRETVMKIRNLLGGLTLSAAVAGGVALPGAAPALASTSDDTLAVHVSSDRGAICSHDAHVRWDRAENYASGFVDVVNRGSQPCSRNLEITFEEENGRPYFQTVVIPTAAPARHRGTPTSVHQKIHISSAVPHRHVQLISNMSAEVTFR
jgi:hypothetical protein